MHKATNNAQGLFRVDAKAPIGDGSFFYLSTIWAIRPWNSRLPRGPSDHKKMAERYSGYKYTHKAPPSCFSMQQSRLAPDRADVLRALSVALASLAETADAADGCARHGDEAADAKDASAIMRRFAGVDAVCRDWRQQARRLGATCDPHGVRLCIAAIEALGADIHGLCVVSASTKEDIMCRAPVNLDQCSHPDPVLWVVADNKGKSAQDDGNEKDGEDSDNGDPEGAVQTVDDICDGDAVSIGLRENNDDTTAKLTRPLQDVDKTASMPPDHLLLSCSRTVGRCDDNPKDRDGTLCGDATAARFVFEVRVGFHRDVWATAGPLVDAETGALVDLACVLVSHEKPHHRDSQGALWMERRRLVDFLMSGHRTWASFAARRYADARRLPGALAARGWKVDDRQGARWSWNPREAPTAESESRSLILSRPKQVPMRMYLDFDGDLLVLSTTDDHWDLQTIDAPGLFPTDPVATVFYRDAPGFPADRCHKSERYEHWRAHTKADMALQRARLAGMGLVSPCVLGGRTDRYVARDAVARNLSYLSGLAKRVLPPVELDAMVDLIEAHVTQAVFGEYGPVDAATGKHINGGLCDDLLAAAVASDRLWSNLRHIKGVNAHAYECPIDCDLALADAVVGDPRMLVNWRAHCAPSYRGSARGAGRSVPLRSPVAVWAAVAVQTDGRGSACVALIVSNQHPLLDELVDDPTADGVTWRAVAERCAKGVPNHPPGLHPALIASLEMERACGLTACVVPWAYHTGTEGPVDARVLTEWALDRVADLFKALDDAIPFLPMPII